VKPLTTQQRKVYEFLKNEIRRNGYPPAIREICEGVGLNSTSTVHTHLKTLEGKGYIRRSTSKNRSIEILEPDFYESRNFNDHEIIELPIVGRVAAGVPILADENIEDTFLIQAEYVSGGNMFMLRVKGDSMIDAGIHHRDLIIVRQQPDADNGDIVVAMLDDSATVKTFYREKNLIRLEPANSAYNTIWVESVRIVGKVVGLFRRF